MPPESKLNKPWMVAVWPGMGHVAISAGYYLMAKLQMHLLAEFSARELFEVEYVDVKDGLAHTGRLPRSRLFVWRDPAGKRDIIVFLGEAQPPSGKYAFCRRLIDFARELGVERVFTFAAMATAMHPSQESRVFGVAADAESLAELKRMDEVQILQEGQIGGLNGVLLGVAADIGMRGACLLGENPHLFSQLPFPKAALAVLDVFTEIAGIELDTLELADQGYAVAQRLAGLLERMQQAIEQQRAAGEDAPEEAPPSPEPTLDDRETEENPDAPDPEDARRIDGLFEQARQNRSTAYELKRELDRLGLFNQYQDRFLDLFKKQE